VLIHYSNLDAVLPVAGQGEVDRARLLAALALASEEIHEGRLSGSRGTEDSAKLTAFDATAEVVEDDATISTRATRDPAPRPRGQGVAEALPSYTGGFCYTVPVRIREVDRPTSCLPLREEAEPEKSEEREDNAAKHCKTSDDSGAQATAAVHE